MCFQLRLLNYEKYHKICEQLTILEITFKIWKFIYLTHFDPLHRWKAVDVLCLMEREKTNNICSFYEATDFLRRPRTDFLHDVILRRTFFLEQNVVLKLLWFLPF